jgi:hypothetical protein
MYSRGTHGSTIFQSDHETETNFLFDKKVVQLVAGDQFAVALTGTQT